MADVRPTGWVVSPHVWRRGAIAGLIVLACVAWAAWALAGLVAAPSVPSAFLALLAVTAAALAAVLGGETVGTGFVRLGPEGYRPPLGAHRSWSDVLALGEGLVQGQLVPVVAVRGTPGGFPVAEDTFTGFPEADAPLLLEALRAWVPSPPGFGAVAVPPSWWTVVDAEADRVREVVRTASGREPVVESREVYGYPGLESALTLNYGSNDAGEVVQVIVRRSSDLALVVDGRRYVRQNRRRSPDPADQVATLFGPHVTERVPAADGGFDQLRVVPEGSRPILFNAEEPDHYV